MSLTEEDIAAVVLDGKTDQETLELMMREYVLESHTISNVYTDNPVNENDEDEDEDVGGTPKKSKARPETEVPPLPQQERKEPGQTTTSKPTPKK